MNSRQSGRTKSFYLNDEVIINFLSALESGKVDEIVSKTVTAREGGFNGGAKIKSPITDLSAGGGRKSSSEIEEEMSKRIWIRPVQKFDSSTGKSKKASSSAVSQA